MKIESFEAHKIVHGAIAHWVVTINGRMRKLEAWCDHFGVSINTVRSRMLRDNWDIREALLEPVNRIDDKAKAYAEKLGVPCFWEFARQHFRHGRSQAKLAAMLGQPSSSVQEFLRANEDKWESARIVWGNVLPSPDGIEWESVVAGERFKLYVSPRWRYVQDGDGPLLKLSEWCRREGMAQGTLNFRLSAGWDLDEAMTREVEVQEQAPEDYDWPPILKQAWGAATKPGRWERGCFGREPLASA